MRVKGARRPYLACADIQLDRFLPDIQVLLEGKIDALLEIQLLSMAEGLQEEQQQEKYREYQCNLMLHRLTPSPGIGLFYPARESFPYLSYVSLPAKGLPGSGARSSRLSHGHRASLIYRMHTSHQAFDGFHMFFLNVMKDSH
jgi:hypothetical protein